MKIVFGKKEEEALYQDALYVRRLVFVEEQHVPVEEEIDHFEDEAIHFVLYDETKPVGAGRLRLLDEATSKIERICVLHDYRKKGIGRLLMEHIEQVAKQHGAAKAKLNAQTHAEPFYKKLGYETISDVFLDAGIPHVTMVKIL
ncbi:GNAT family N-acetyltransferase [Anoxybacillus sp. J5B_2022]|uniref:GNAT family N-acetyltransferase n=1 Tax=Anoxybacillus sp. J5B_2022 TaxID=3003246 RepID=UPI002286275C|nr:GNAT family N-acetyltransferase [Anoxybacillus sp. J5B_2022]MCZ0756183.1 GNAT family N-acetyltransferase [Anoxybacillus sp. J5B_2022]